MFSQQSESEVTMTAAVKKHPKLRSTCDACIAAKIRCGRDIPQCFRCQIYKINCVYSVSRRMGRPRKAKPASQGEQEQNDKSTGGADASSKERSPPEIQTIPIQKEPQDTLATLASSQQTSNQDEQEPLALSSPSAMPLSSDIPLIIDGDLSGSSNDSLETMTPVLHENIYMLNQSPIGDISGQINGFSELSPIDISYDAPFSDISQNTVRRIQDPLSFNSEANNHPGDQSLWGEHKANDVCSAENESQTFGSLMDLDTLNFSKNSALGKFINFENQPAIQSPTIDQDHERPFSYPAADQAFMSTSLTSTRCECYKSTLLVLLSLEEALPYTTPITLDTALQLNKDVLANNTKFMQCTVCASARSNQLLLQAIILNRIVGMLESKSSTGLKSPINNYRPLSLRGPSGGSGLPQNETSILASAEDCTLQVGTYEVLDEKNIFIKQLLQMRLNNLMGTLRSMQTATQGELQDSSAKLTGMILMETSLTLRSVVGRVELWNV